MIVLFVDINFKDRFGFMFQIKICARRKRNRRHGIGEDNNESIGSLARFIDNYVSFFGGVVVY